MRLSTLTTLALLAGCRADPGPAARQSLASPWVYEAEDTGAGGEDGAALALAMQAVVDHIPTWRAEPLLLSYHEARALGAGGCPDEGSMDAGALGVQTWWYGACSTPGGVHFNGVMTAWDWTDLGVEAVQVLDIAGRLPAGYTYSGGGFEGRIDIFDEAGTADFSCSCEGVQGVGLSAEGAPLWFSYARGPASWTGPAAEGSWLAEEGVRAAVWQRYDLDLATGRLTGEAEVDVTGLGGRFGTGRVHARVSVDAEGESFACHEPALDGSLRDALSAEWLPVAFRPAQPGSCEVCLDTDPTACVDLNPLVAAEARPW